MNCIGLEQAGAEIKQWFDFGFFYRRRQVTEYAALLVDLEP